ncbi:nucleotidyltransferase domain-containing protein [Halobacillus litoralis]|uniref:nucleotidyltransferase domain-containing protein n=1 Tax=Halobacillus litoralis TaxID=45668 RepID=UPI001CFEE0DB|nr:nucleotidyltransferase domain-containing protein [Halobacillus litoralis]
MRQNEAVETITNSLKNDRFVKAVFLKGSMGRGEEDEHSDVDLYVLVEEQDKQEFLQNRQRHLESYQSLIFYDDIYIIAPQIIAVFENLLHVDLFTVTEEALIHKDYMKVLYDPDHLMEKHKEFQNLSLSQDDFLYAVDDVAFFFLQYKKAADRGNDLWAVKVANDIGVNLAKVLLQIHCPERAQLGLKTVDRSLPEEVAASLKEAYAYLTIYEHKKGIRVMAELVQFHLNWLEDEWGDNDYTIPFLKRMLGEIKTWNT